jgi:hypothetical protein
MNLLTYALIGWSTTQWSQAIAIQFTGRPVEAPATALTSSKLAEGVVDVAKEITNGNTNRIGALAIDTCPSMLALHEILSTIPGMGHMFAVLRNSHSLKLLISDILSLSGIKEFWKSTSNIANGIWNAPKQYAYLQAEQEKVYRHRQAIIQPGDTRWGTQYRMTESLENSRQALRQFAVHPEVSFEYTTSLLDHSFWGQLTELLELLQLLHKAQVISEDNKSTLAYIYLQWIKITAHLQKIADSSSSFAAPIKSFLEDNNSKSWNTRINRQVTGLHTAAYYLQPCNIDKLINQGQQDQIRKLFKQYFSNYDTIFRSFLDFRNRCGIFHPGSEAWSMTEDRDLFWLYNQAMCPILSALAIRLLNTIANSVPSERVSSNMNYTHSKARNRLSLETVDKLLFIYINSRTLQHIKNNGLVDLEELAWGD